MKGSKLKTEFTAQARRPPRGAVRLPIRVVWLAVVLLAALPVHAQPAAVDATEDACLQNSECVGHYQSARQLSKAGQSAAALAEYQTAYQRIPAPRLLYSIARLQHKLGQTKEALVSYQRFLATAVATDEELRVKAREYQVQLERETASPAATGAAATQSLSPTGEQGIRPTTPPHQPIYKKWWLWTLVGVVAAGAITATVVAVYPRDLPIPGNAQSFSLMF